MSADNWAECPKCYRSVEDRLAEIYGKLPLEAFDRQRREIENNAESFKTLREDYDLGIIAGEFFIEFSASCGACGFSFKHSHKEKIK